MPEADKRSDQEKLLDDICPIHQTPMHKEQQHVGAGKVEWSTPTCTLCEELKAGGKYDEALASIKADANKRGDKDFLARLDMLSKPMLEQKEPQQPSAVKPAAAAPAAKT